MGDEGNASKKLTAKFLMVYGVGIILIPL